MKMWDNFTDNKYKSTHQIFTLSSGIICRIETDKTKDPSKLLNLNTLWMGELMSSCTWLVLPNSFVKTKTKTHALEFPWLEQIAYPMIFDSEI